MPSFSKIAGVLALTGAALAANSTAPYSMNNGTDTGAAAASGTTGATSLSTGTATPSSNSTNAEGAICPALNLQVMSDRNGFSFLIECNTNHFGTIIEIDFSIAKRQAANAPTSLADCMVLCDSESACVGTAYDSNVQTCTLFSEVGAQYTDAGVDFAVRVGSGAASTLSAGATGTSTLYSTTVETISSCAPTVTDCPLKNNAAVVTQVIPVTSTEYICPSATVVPVAPVACACAYSASTVAVYSSTVTMGSTIYVPVTSTIVAIPMPTGTTMSTTACGGCATSAKGNYGLATGTISYKPSSTSGMTVFTGAAGRVEKAGMGMAAIVAGAAILL